MTVPSKVKIYFGRFLFNEKLLCNIKLDKKALSAKRHTSRSGSSYYPIQWGEKVSACRHFDGNSIQS
jgi:hypothetical protein